MPPDDPGLLRTLMTFLNPLVLLGLAAAAIPLLIHLFNFRRPKRVEFSSLAFLREVQRSTMQRVRIKQWLLLVLRTLAIAFLVLAFARPTLRGGLAGLFGSNTPSAVVILVDDSPSMQVRDAGGAYLDQAMEAARAIGLATDARDEVSILTTSGKVVLEAAPGGAVAASGADAVEGSPATGTIERSLALAGSILERSSLPNREVWSVSDLQASTLFDSVAVPSPPTPIRLVPIGSRSEPNVAVVDVRVVSRIVEAEQPMRLEVDLVNHGTSTASGYTAGVEAGGVRLAQVAVDLPPGERVTAAMTITPQERGWTSATVVTEDDAFPADNVFHFAYLVPESRRVLLVAGDGADAGYIETALSERLTGAAIGVDLVTVAERALPSTTLSDFDVVVLAAPVDLSSGEVDRIARFVQDGGGLMFFPGRDARLPDYNALTTAVGAGRVVGIAESGPDGVPVDVLDRLEREHPLFEGMFEARAGEVERAVLYRRMEYVPASSRETTLMTLASGTPFMQEVRFGRGTVLILATAPDPSWSDLPTRGLFLPLLYRSIFLLSSTGTVQAESFRVGEPAPLFLPGLAESERVELESPTGHVSAPVTRSVSGGLLASLDGWIGETGSYVVRADGRIIRRIAVNPDPRESDLARSDADDAATRMSQRFGRPVDVVALEGGLERARAAVEAERRGVELWNVFLFLALLCLVAETAVAAFWKPEAAG